MTAIQRFNSALLPKPTAADDGHVDIAQNRRILTDLDDRLRGLQPVAFARLTRSPVPADGLRYRRPAQGCVARFVEAVVLPRSDVTRLNLVRLQAPSGEDVYLFARKDDIAAMTPTEALKSFVRVLEARWSGKAPTD